MIYFYQYGSVPALEKVSEAKCQLRVSQRYLLNETKYDFSYLKFSLARYFVVGDFWAENEYFSIPSVARLFSVKTNETIEIPGVEPERISAYGECSGYIECTDDFPNDKTANLHIYNPNTGCCFHISRSKGSFQYVVDEVVFLWDGIELFAYDMNGELRWKRNVSVEFSTKKNLTWPRPGLMHWKNSVIWLQRTAENAFNLLSLELQTGKLLWQHPLDGFISRISFIDGKLLVTPNDRLRIIDADNGAIIEELPIRGTNHEGYLTPWTDGIYFYVLDQISQKLFILQRGQEQPIASLTPPPGYAYQNVRSFAHYDGKNYLDLVPNSQTFSGCYGGLLVWKAEDIHPGVEIEVEPLPPHTIDIIKFSMREAYSVHVDTHDIHTLLRFGELIIQRLAADRGKTDYWCSKNRNRKFDGQIELVVDVALGEEVRPYLDFLIRGCNAKLTLSQHSGNGKDPIRVTWRFVNEPSKMVDLDSNLVVLNPYAAVSSLEEIDSTLNNMKIRLDATEYDDESEFEEALKELYPTAVKQAAQRAAELGSMQGHHLYGRLLLDEIEAAKRKYRPWKNLLKQARQHIIIAARLGCPGAMEDLAAEKAVELGCSWSEQIAYTLMAGGDVDKLVAHHKEHHDVVISETDIEKGRKLHKKLVKEVEKSGGKKSYCDCLFP